MSTQDVTKDKIRIVVLDDHAVARMGVVALLREESDLEVVGLAENGRSALNLCQEKKPDIALVDLRLPDMSGVDAVRLIVENMPETKVVVLSSSHTEEDVHGAVEAGARAYLLKSMNAGDVVDAVRKVHAGEMVIPEEVAEKIRERRAHEQLTRREIEIVNFIAKGTINRDIGRELNLTEGTVKVYIVGILAKLGARDRTAAVTEAIRRGIIDVQGNDR